MAKHMWRHTLIRDRRLFLSSGTDVFIEDVLESSSRHGPPASIEKHFLGDVIRPYF